MLVAVGEAATSIGKTGRGEATVEPRRGSHTRGRRTVSLFALRHAVFAAWVLAGAVPALMPVASEAQVVIAPGSDAHVIQTANGIQQVNITAPSGAGVSQNAYSQFDVPKAGIVLNNSPAMVSTRQAGYINGNPNFAPGQSAKIILNHVNGNSPSQLRGYIEVAGSKAEVVVANASGIVVDGGGFINTTRGVLTTGSPLIGANGSLAGFNVSDGQISVQGAGLNASNIDQVDLISRAVAVNAAFYADTLNVITGVNHVDHDTLATRPIVGSGVASGVSIDVSQLGGMYANRIRLVGTENGVGVSLGGIAAAQAGDLTLTAEGKLVLSGKANASGDMVLSAHDGINNSGAIYAQQVVSVSTAAGDLIHSGTLAAQQNLTVTANNVASTGTLGSGIDRDGSIARSGDLRVTAGHTLSATGLNVAGGHATLTGAALNLAGSQTSANGDLTLTSKSGDLDLANATTIAGGALSAHASGALVNDEGSLSSQGAMQLAGASLSDVGGQIISQSTLDVQSGGAVDNRRGVMQAAGRSKLNAASLDNTAGSISAGGNLNTIVTGAVNNQHGTLSGAVTAVSCTSIDNSSGTIDGKGDVTVDAQDLANTMGARIVGAGATNLNVVRSVNNAGGTIYGGTALNLNSSGATLINDGGAIESGRNVSVQVASLSNQSGTIRANRDIAASGAMTGSGEMTAGRNLALTIAGDYANDAMNSLHADGDMTVSVTGTLTNTGTLAAVGALTASGANVVNAAGADIHASSTTVNAADTLTNAGRIEGDVVATNSPTLANTGTLIGNTVQVNATDVWNAGAPAMIAGAQRVRIHASNAVSNTDGARIYSAGNLEIAKDGTRELAGISSGRASGLLANQTGSLTNRAASIEADGDVDIAARTVNNIRTGVVTQAGKPTVTGSTTLTIWTAGIPIGYVLNSHRSSTFLQWNWTKDGAPLKAEIVDKLATPVSVTVPKLQVTNLDTTAQTFSLSQPLTENYKDDSKTKVVCSERGRCRTRGVLQSRNIATHPTQWYNSLTDNDSGSNGNNGKNNSGTYTLTFWPDFDPNRHIRPDQVKTRFDLGPDSRDYSETSRTVQTTATTDRLVSAGGAARIQAQGAIRINADGGSVRNASSVIAAGGDLVRRANGGSINDTGTVLQQTLVQNSQSTFYWHQKRGDWNDTQTLDNGVTQSTTTIDALPAIASSNQNVETTAQTLIVRSVNRQGETAAGSGVTGGSVDGTLTGTQTDTIGAQSARPQAVGGATGGMANLKLPLSGLYTYHIAPGAAYLIETDPRFTQYTNVISSDYMLGQLGLDPQKIAKRLGDGLYEQNLIRDQVTQLTGRTFLAGYTDNLAEYTALMSSGVAYAKAFGLEPGIALTPAQMRQLTTDMVWLVSQDVTLPDGSHQTVLVPQLYLAQSGTVDLTHSGALVAGNRVNLIASGDANNSGHIVSHLATTVIGNSITNSGIIGSAGSTVVAAVKDMRNTSGRIGGGDVLVQAGRDIINETQTYGVSKSFSSNSLKGSVTGTGVDAIGTISATNRATVLADRDVNLTGSTIQAGSNAAIAAGRDLNVDTARLTSTQDVQTRDGLNGGHDRVTQNLVSAIVAGGEAPRPAPSQADRHCPRRSN